MPLRRFSALLLALLVVGVSVPSALAAGVIRRGGPWATVNICNTPTHPDVIGIRGSMPSRGRQLRMYMRFQVQYLSSADHRWHAITNGADSRFVFIGPGSRGTLQAGWSFPFMAPPAGQSYELRGLVTYQWRARGGRVVGHTQRVTTAGHPSPIGSDPIDYSAATCVLQ